MQASALTNRIFYPQKREGFGVPAHYMLEVSNTLIKIDMLKILAHKYEIPIIAMSSLNRTSYADPDLASVKGSGEIEYTASTVFLLSDADAENKNQPTEINKRSSNRSCRNMSSTRTVRITAAKNRMGQRNATSLLRFNEEYNQFQEVSANIAR